MEPNQQRNLKTNIFQFVDRQFGNALKPLNLFLDHLMEPLDPLLAKLTVYLFLISTVGLGIITFWRFYDFYIKSNKLILVAGKASGESYIISKALAQVVHTYNDKIDIEVVETDGTDENLEALAGNLHDSDKVKPATKNQIQQNGGTHADLATAQSDVITDALAKSSTIPAGTIAILYTDFVQLVVRKDLVASNSLRDSFKGKKIKIEVPKKGGQLTTWSSIAQHYGLQEDRDFLIVPENDPKAAFCQHNVDAVFRVRTLGDREISDILACGGKLLPIEEGEAMKIQHPAFQSKALIPQGAYRGDIPIPAKDLETISMQRLLISHNDVPNELIQKIMTILHDHRKEIVQKIDKIEIKPLAPYIVDDPNIASTGMSLHQGASDYYKGYKPSILKNNADVYALVVSVISLIASMFWNLNERLTKKRKDKADEYIKLAEELMESNIKLPELFDSHKKLEQIFHAASKDLRNEKISQESFRTFNETYKTSREFIERTIQEKQREVSTNLVKKVMNLLDKPARLEDLLKELDSNLIVARESLIQEQTFSRESFQTFIESYHVVKEALTRRV